MTVEVKGWDELLHPRGPGGKFAPKGSEEAAAAKRDADKKKVEAARDGDDVVVTVKAGDTLYELAEKYLGDGERWQEIAKANGVDGADPRKMPVGIKLTIPGPVQTTEGADRASLSDGQRSDKPGKPTRESRRRKPKASDKPKLQEDAVPRKSPEGAAMVEFDGRTGAATYADGSRFDADGWRDDKVSDEEVAQLRVNRTASRRRAGQKPLPEDLAVIGPRKSFTGGATMTRSRNPLAVKSAGPPVAASAPSGLQHKAISGTGVKVLDEQEGVVKAIVSVTGFRDQVADVIRPDAYARTLKARRPKGVSGHDWEKPVAKALDVVELLPGDSRLPTHTNHGEPWPTEAGALDVTSVYNLDTALGRDTYSNVKFYGPDQEWSIGYNVPRGGATMDHKSATRYLDTLDLFEWSDVLFGAMPLAGTRQGVKGLLVGATADDLLLEGKTLPGTVEERLRLLDQAVTRELLGDLDSGGTERGWVSIVGTYDDRVIVRQYGGGILMDADAQEWQIGYELRDGIVRLGSREPVKVTEQVTVLPSTAPASLEEKAPLTAAELAETDELWSVLR